MNRLRSALKELLAYPSAMIGLVIILALVGISIYTMIAIPYPEAIKLWRGGEDVWYDTPKKAEPAWFNLFREADLSETIVVGSRDGSIVKSAEVVSEAMTDVTFSLPFDYPYDGFPQEISIFFEAQFQDKFPHVSLTWLTPDGREIRVADFRIEGQSQSYRVSQDKKLERRLGGQHPHVGLFADPTSEEPVALAGTYTLQVSALLFEENAGVDAEMVIFGQVHGLAGTDHRRRDLMVALLWGTPIALSFGLLAALGTSITTMTIAGIGTWFGGWVDELIQRITEVNMILPLLPILIMVGTFYSKSLWLMLGVLILLNIFGGGIKIYRAVFLQVKESPYMEAARAYGASDWRMVFTYLVPRIIPMLIPQLVTVIPVFVFIEASLAVLGLGDPILPTWGKLINDARVNGALYDGQYYWMLEPAILLMFTGLSFSLLGFSLDRIFNPRLRGL
ncbi:MAG: ABC transporter permease subunit [Ardenticatenales bacterium]|nr:ABC transporter permease subunit [Ardenticatenales bacterium]